MYRNDAATLIEDTSWGEKCEKGAFCNGIVSFERNNRWGLYNIYEQKEFQPAIYRCILPIKGIEAVVDDSNMVYAKSTKNVLPLIL